MSDIELLMKQGKDLRLSDPLGALNYFSEALELASIEAHPGLRLELLLEMSYVHRTMTNVKDGFTCAAEALELSKVQGKTLESVKAFNFLGIFCYYSGLYKRALNYFYDGLDLGMQLGPEKIQISLYTNIGETYKSLSSYQQASNYFERAYALSRAAVLKPYYTPILCNMGDICLKNGDLDMAASLFKQAHAYRDESVDPIYCAELDFKRALLEKRAGQPEEAVALFRMAEKQYRRLNHKFYLIDVLIELTEFNGELARAESEASLMEARQIAIEISAQSKLATIAFKLYELAEARGDFQAALDYYKQFHETAARSDANAILNKLEIMNLDRLHLENLKELDVKDFANLEIFSNTDINKYIDYFHKEMHYKANTDELTGLPNRRRINAQLRDMLIPHEGNVNAFFLLDIDHFKLVNDAEGHLYGDRCLMRVAKVIREWSHQYGIFVGRYGGEEFLALAENIPESQISVMGEDLRHRIEMEGIVYHLDGEEKHLTASIGCAGFREGDFNEITKRLEQADRSLYMAKSLGRNRVMILT